MEWQLPAYLSILLLAGAGSSVLAIYSAFRYRRGVDAEYVGPFAVLCFATAIWSFGYGFQLASADPRVKLLAYRALHVGGVAVPVAWFAFAVRFTGRSRWLTRGTLAALSLLPGALLFVLVADPYPLALTDVTVDASGSHPVLVTGNGPLYVLFLGYSYVLLLAGSYAITKHALGSATHFRRRSALLVAGAVLPLVANVWHLFEFPPFEALRVNVTPLSLAVPTLLFGVALFNYRLLDLTPVARATVFETMEEGVVVLNGRERVVDFNPAARSLIGDLEGAIGAPASDVVPGYERIVDGGTDVVDLDADGGSEPPGSVVRMTRTPVANDGAANGWILLLGDITDLERQRRELERRNDRLDAFAGTIAHDLRNRIAVVQTSNALARQTGSEEHFERIDETVSHTLEFLDELLLLSRQGETIQERSRVSLSAVAEDAVADIDADGVALSVRTDATVLADRGRLRQALSNLFKNADDHGRGEVRVRVGALPDGFYVEDTGPGIPESEREDVFESGYTMSETGTGFGLAIVAEIVEAHGWRIDVTDGADGGARFEITGVEFVE